MEPEKKKKKFNCVDSSGNKTFLLKHGLPPCFLFGII